MLLLQQASVLLDLVYFPGPVELDWALEQVAEFAIAARQVLVLVGKSEKVVAAHAPVDDCPLASLKSAPGYSELELQVEAQRLERAGRVWANCWWELALSPTLGLQTWV